MFSILSGIINPSRLRQLEKASEPIVCKPSGNSTTPIRRQLPAKAPFPIDAISLGSLSVPEKSHPKKAFAPSVVKSFGNTNSPLRGLPSNAPVCIPVMPSCNWRVPLRPVFWNAYCDIDVTPCGILRSPERLVAFAKAKSPMNSSFSGSTRLP